MFRTISYRNQSKKTPDYLKQGGFINNICQIKPFIISHRMNNQRFICIRIDSLGFNPFVDFIYILNILNFCVKLGYIIIEDLFKYKESVL